MLAIVDGDIVAYRCAASAERDGLEIALVRAEQMMNDMLRATKSKTYHVFLTGKGNFRYDLYPDYKANRKDKPKPIYLQDCREYLVNMWNAVISVGCEADDLIGITATNLNDTDSHVICSIDKDLLQIPGHHFNFVKQEHTYVSPVEGMRSFYKQLILGDVSDNIPGYDGKARQKWPNFMKGYHDYIDNAHDEYDMYSYVKSIYSEGNDIHLNGKLLFIQRKENQMWEPPNDPGIQIEVRGTDTETPPGHSVV